MASEPTRDELGGKLGDGRQIDPPQIREIEFEVRSMGHLPPGGFTALTEDEIAAKPWIDNRMITVEWSYHIPTAPDGSSEDNLKSFLDGLKDDNGEKRVHELAQSLGFQYLGTHRIGFLSFDPAGHFKTLFAFRTEEQMRVFLRLPIIERGTDNAGVWEQLEDVIDQTFRRRIGRTSPLKITTYFPAIGWNTSRMF